jgi:enolase
VLADLTLDNGVRTWAMVPSGASTWENGSASRSERIAKYNRLLIIEAELGVADRFREDRFWQR